MKEASKRVISNETSQDRSIRLKDAAIRYVAKISNETLQERTIRLENAAKHIQLKNQVKRHQKELVDCLEKHDFEKPEAKNTQRNSTTSQGQCRKLRLRYLRFR
jgi:hypothetical protein